MPVVYAVKSLFFGPVNDLFVPFVILDNSFHRTNFQLIDPLLFLALYNFFLFSSGLLCFTSFIRCFLLTNFQLSFLITKATFLCNYFFSQISQVLYVDFNCFWFKMNPNTHCIK